MATKKEGGPSTEVVVVGLIALTGLAYATATMLKKGSTAAAQQGNPNPTPQPTPTPSPQNTELNAFISRLRLVTAEKSDTNFMLLMAECDVAKNLKKGTIGKEVAVLQKILKENSNLLKKNIVIDGLFGSGTEAALSSSVVSTSTNVGYTSITLNTIMPLMGNGIYTH